MRLVCLWMVLVLAHTAWAADRMPIIEDVPAQPLLSQAQRVAGALEYLGSALKAEDREKLGGMMAAPLTEATSQAIQAVLDPYCIAFVNINPEARVKVRRGPAEAMLQENGWVTYLVKVENEAGTRAELQCTSPNWLPVVHASTAKPVPDPKNAISPGELENRFLEISMYGAAPMERGLSGLTLEYRIVQLYTSRTGQYEALLSFNVGQGTEDIGSRSEIPVLFNVRPSVKVVLGVKDHDGKGTTASFIVRDNIDRFTDRQDPNVMPKDYRLAKAQQHPWLRQGLENSPLLGVYPLPSRRVADRDEYPDFYFHPQVYRADGEHIFLPPGKYDVTWTRGPEYLSDTRTIEVREGEKKQREEFKLTRWTHLAKRGWYSCDHHVHAGGCSHYESPQAGVRPEAMLRQAMGEDLNIACVLTWGPCWYHQKTFFDGEISELSKRDNVMRYDVEVSGFPSSHAGHVVLLRLKEDDYPGTTKIEEWPTWTFPVMKWAQEQGGVAGYAHSGWGLEPQTRDDTLPNYAMPKFDGIGANEYIVTATLGACDFISAGDTPLPWELNIWYHILNCGIRTSISGETDFPCIFDDRVGMARSYAKLDKLDFDAFADAIKRGANYVSDGRSHILDFTVGGARMGEEGGELKIAAPEVVDISAEVFAYLPEAQDSAGAHIQAGGVWGAPYWHVEKARIGTSRKVAVELLVNGYPLQYTEIVADGTPQKINFQQKLDRSSWVALRILATSHTNPVYVLVGDQPIRASRRSAQWCRDAVDTCWKMKSPAFRPEELAAASNGYDHARKTYSAILAESYDDTQDTVKPIFLKR
jgi:hypothetical protein